MKKGLIVITGASSGFGAAIAQRFSDLGYPLLLIARRLDRIEALGLPNALCKAVDVTDSAAFRNSIIAAEAEYGATECLINNAGVMLLGSVADQSEDEWKQMYSVNVLALLSGMQIVLSSMKERNSGTIINISSIAGRKGFSSHAAYCGTKFAVHAISETVREEVADANVRVITIAPGAAATELLGHTTSTEIKDGYGEWAESIGGALAADDIARSVVFAYEQPQNVCIREIVLAPTRQQP
ncbi:MULTISPECIES: SDR family oxidoreductase [unclassified Lentimonas]|uniref:SDR family oxidoreductase n=1 Tax=unclassified Lentimonas TaxID=2630993 RepID=UPI00132936AD|nr:MULTISPECIES: SDR family oxidoreductase [unclassified Lentimonas]CAA6691294.1 Short-chain dehydrogenase/reductase SDR [Lentimonas sp. CC19]CAA6694875.1 Short-chain dehydrogenase/reductase SDR [Lentimonas sp. CC10]CAA7071933.1 Short-chain dehydrogenase/reductase SDR [Lentimonas sp. CC11]